MRWSILACAALTAVSCGKKGTEQVKVTGWQKSDGDAYACWYPSDFASLGAGDRRIAWQKNMDAMMGQWNGSRGDGVSFDERMLMEVETVLLGKPEAVEEVAAQNLQQCLDSKKAGSTIAWGNWLQGLPSALTEGECPYPPLDYTLYDYLDIGNEWQIPAYVCENNRIKIVASSMDFYQTEEEGPWINAEGHTDRPASGELPCTIEGCFEGQLVMRFKGDSGIETIIPIGLGTTWTAPEHGQIHVMINDDTFYNNKFKVESGIEHHTSIEYSPVKK